jgi:acyl dehydratase
MNILTTNGLVGRFVTDWAGPDARITSVAIRLGTPNLPGDTMKLRGTVKGKNQAKGTVEVDVKGANAWGNHVTGTVVVELPKEKM